VCQAYHYQSPIERWQGGTNRDGTVEVEDGGSVEWGMVESVEWGMVEPVEWGIMESIEWYPRLRKKLGWSFQV